MEKYLYFVFLLILVFLLVAPHSRAQQIIAALGNASTRQIVALQGRQGSVLGGVA